MKFPTYEETQLRNQTLYLAEFGMFTTKRLDIYLVFSCIRKLCLDSSITGFELSQGVRILASVATYLNTGKSKGYTTLKYAPNYHY